MVIGHCDMVPDHDYHLALVGRGAWVQFDTVQGVHEWDTQQRLGWLRSLADAGHLGRVLLSQDVCLRSDYAAMGGPGYAYVVTTFADRLREAGFDDADITALHRRQPAPDAHGPVAGGSAGRPVLRQRGQQQVGRQRVGGATARSASSARPGSR